MHTWGVVWAELPCLAFDTENEWRSDIPVTYKIPLILRVSSFVISAVGQLNSPNQLIFHLSSYVAARDKHNITGGMIFMRVNIAVHSKFPFFVALYRIYIFPLLAAGTVTSLIGGHQFDCL